MAISVSAEQLILGKEADRILHSEIRKRYQLTSIEKIDAIQSEGLLDGVTQDDIDNLESLFNGTVYPEAAEREELDRSFDSMVRMLKRPHKLAFIIPSVTMISMRHATLFPAAMKIGLSSILAYVLSKKLEKKLVTFLESTFAERGEKITEKTVVPFEDFRAAYVSVPRAEGMRMLGYANAVFRAGKNKALLKATGEILGDVRGALAEKDARLKRRDAPPQHKDDCAAIGFGLRVLDKVTQTFNLYSDEKMDRMIRISYLTEVDYMDNAYGGQ